MSQACNTSTQEAGKGTCCRSEASLDCTVFQISLVLGKEIEHTHWQLFSKARTEELAVLSLSSGMVNASIFFFSLCCFVVSKAMPCFSVAVPGWDPGPCASRQLLAAELHLQSVWHF